jgi:hypothetical protein
MSAIVLILSGILQYGIITGFVPLPVNAHMISINLLDLFNGQFLFIMKFFGEVILVFLFGGMIGKLLHLDKAYKSGSHSNS